MIAIEGTILEANDKDFVIKPNHHIDISMHGVLQYVPFTSNGVIIKYGTLKKLAKLSGATPKQMFTREIGSSGVFQVEKNIVKKKGELGEIYKSLYFTCKDIG